MKLQSICLSIISITIQLSLESSSQKVSPFNDYLLIAEVNQLKQFNVTSKQFTSLLIVNQHSISSIEFDYGNSCVFWGDSDNNVIKRQCLNNNQPPKVLTYAKFGEGQGMSYDWLSQTLYFIDIQNNIEAITAISETAATTDMRRTIVKNGRRTIATSICVHPVRGYLYWIQNRNMTALRSIWRSQLDGSQVRQLIGEPTVMLAYDITIDYATDRIYWIDWYLKSIGSCDLNGQNVIKFIEDDVRIKYASAIVVHQQTIYWSYLLHGMVYAMDKGTRNISSIKPEKPIVDMKAMSNPIQYVANACSGLHNCSYSCVGASNDKFSCLCPEGMTTMASGQCQCPGNARAISFNGICTPFDGHCGEHFFECANKRCIPELHRCDRKNNCGDNSDEDGCSAGECMAYSFQCKFDKKCIPRQYKCNGHRECSDGSDEEDCTIDCQYDEFQCAEHECILLKNVCDGVKQCISGLDEQNCGSIRSSCETYEFMCADRSCVYANWRCDGENDCHDGGDEIGCGNNSTSRILPTTASGLRISNLTFDIVSSDLQWDVPGNASHYSYAVYFGTTMDELDAKPKIITDDTTVKLTDLFSCEKYFVDVIVVNRNYVNSFLTHQYPLEFFTPYNEQRPVSHLVATIAYRTRTMNISWEHNCRLNQQRTPIYLLTITELVQNNRFAIALEKHKFDPLWYEFRNISRGAVYNVTLTLKNRPETIISTVVRLDLPSPVDLKIRSFDNGTAIFTWDQVKYDDEPFTYDVLISKSKIMNDLTADIARINAIKPPLYYNLNEFGHMVSVTTNFTVAVVLKTQRGFSSAAVRFQHIEIKPSHQNGWQSSNYLLMWTIFAIVIVSQSALVFYCYQRNRRRRQNETIMTTWSIRDNLYRNMDANNASQEANINAHSDDDDDVLINQRR